MIVQTVAEFFFYSVDLTQHEGLQHSASGDG